MTFGRWQRLRDATIPDTPGLLQARYDQGAAGLLTYPSGRSAMVYYDADDQNLRHAVERLRARAGVELDRIYVRFAEASEPRAALAVELEQFRRRFGALPLFNQL